MTTGSGVSFEMLGMQGSLVIAKYIYTVKVQKYEVMYFLQPTNTFF